MLCPETHISSMTRHNRIGSKLKREHIVVGVEGKHAFIFTYQSMSLANQNAVLVVSSKLDHSVSPSFTLAKLQRFQNCLARVITKALKFVSFCSNIKQLI